MDNNFMDWVCGKKGSTFPFFQDMPQVQMPAGFSPKETPEPEDDARESALQDRESGNW